MWLFLWGQLSSEIEPPVNLSHPKLVALLQTHWFLSMSIIYPKFFLYSSEYYEIRDVWMGK